MNTYQANLARKLCVFTFGLAFLCLAAISCAQAGEHVLPETRGVWLDVRSLPDNEMALDLIVDRLQQANFNAIFVETFYNSETIYPSPYLEALGMNYQMGGFSGGDPLQWLITSAHRRGMQVHAWFHLFYVGLNEPGPLLSARPDWASINRDGSSGYRVGNNQFFWACPTQPGVSDFYRGLAEELVSRYPVDGIQLDYVRFPDPVRADAGYSETARRDFLSDHGIDPIMLDPELHPQLYAQWNRYRAHRMSEVVAAIADGVRAIRPEVIISASVMPSGMPIELNPSYLQDWPRWAEAGYLDVVIPMAYRSRVNEMQGMLVLVKHFLQGNIPYFAGLQAFRLDNPAELARQVTAARQLGSSGVVAFAWPNLNDHILTILAQGPFSYPVPPAQHQDLLSWRSPDGRQPALYRHETPRRITAQFLEAPPPLSASFDGPPWQDLTWQGEFVVITGEELAIEQTWITTAYSNEALYIALQVDDTFPETIKATITGRDGPVFYDDSVEAFLDPGHTLSFYYHLAVNSLGTQYDSYSRTGPGWNGNWQVNTAFNDDGWAVLLKIPFADLGLTTPHPGEVWGINLTRTMIRLDEFSGWSCTLGTFHAPSFFGELMFGENPGQ